MHQNMGGGFFFGKGSGNPFKPVKGFWPFEKGFAADFLSREGTDTLVLIPFIK